MLHESPHLQVQREFDIVTLWLSFPGEPVNALDSARLAEIDAALAVLERTLHTRILVVRSAKPAGFCAGLSPAALASLKSPADRASFAWLGQQVAARLARLPFTTIAFLEGPCLGAGLELALACDYRLCQAGLQTHLGFPQRFTCLGGSSRLRQLLGRHARPFIESGRTISGREAQAMGLVYRAFCERRAKIELQSFLDLLEARQHMPFRKEVPGGLAEERRSFAAAVMAPFIKPAALPVPLALARGFITPLEAERLRDAPIPAGPPGDAAPARAFELAAA